MEHLNEKRMTERVYVAEVKRRKVEGRLYTRWLDGVTKDYNAISLEVRDENVKCR